jgi:hypothetical protein
MSSSLSEPLHMLRSKPTAKPAAKGRTHSHRVTLNRVHRRFTTTQPSIAPPALICPSCIEQMRYVQSYIGGVSALQPEQWDYFVCQTGCGTFQYRHRTRKLRQIS